MLPVLLAIVLALLPIGWLAVRLLLLARSAEREPACIPTNRRRP